MLHVIFVSSSWITSSSVPLPVYSIYNFNSNLVWIVKDAGQIVTLSSHRGTKSAPVCKISHSGPFTHISIRSSPFIVHFTFQGILNWLVFTIFTFFFIFSFFLLHCNSPHCILWSVNQLHFILTYTLSLATGHDSHSPFFHSSSVDCCNLWTSVHISLIKVPFIFITSPHDLIKCELKRERKRKQLTECTVHFQQLKVHFLPVNQVTIYSICRWNRLLYLSHVIHLIFYFTSHAN